MNLAQLEARLRSDNALERNLAVGAAINELQKCYDTIRDLTNSIGEYLSGVTVEDEMIDEPNGNVIELPFGEPKLDFTPLPGGGSPE